MRVLVLCVIWLAGMASAQGQRSGDFDYYVMALSWTPTWCAIEGDARASPQCDVGLGLGFTLHGLWPQYEQGWPSFCPTAARPPSRTMTEAMADIMGSSGLAWHQWRKHGSCSGLSAQAYFQQSRQAYGQIVKPSVLTALDRAVRLPAGVIEEAFLEENPGLTADMITVTCRDGRVQEVRICLTRDLAPRTCAPDVARDCSLRDALLAPIR
jgi:ribonuclease T2